MGEVIFLDTKFSIVLESLVLTPINVERCPKLGEEIMTCVQDIGSSTAVCYFVLEFMCWSSASGISFGGFFSSATTLRIHYLSISFSNSRSCLGACW